MQLCSEEFNLSVKRLSRGISGMIDEIVEYFSLSISNGCGNSTEILVPKVGQQGIHLTRGQTWVRIVALC